MNLISASDKLFNLKHLVGTLNHDELKFILNADVSDMTTPGFFYNDAIEFVTKKSIITIIFMRSRIYKDHFTVNYAYHKDYSSTITVPIQRNEWIDFVKNAIDDVDNVYNDFYINENKIIHDKKIKFIRRKK